MKIWKLKTSTAQGCVSDTAALCYKSGEGERVITGP